MAVAISLFAGAGGCSLGFKCAGFEIIYASDINKQAVSTYKENFPNTLCEQDDIVNIDFHQLMSRLHLRPGDVDIVIGGPPCQGFSSAGLQFWDDPRNLMLKHYIRALNILQPKWFLMENVEGLLTANKGNYIHEFGKALIEMGYKIRIDKVYAHEYGVPQRRKRVFVIGNRIGADYELPKIVSHATGSIFRNTEFTILDAIGGLPKSALEQNELIPYSSPPASDWENFIRGDATRVTLHYSPKLSEIQLVRIQHLKEGQTMKDLPPYLQHESFKRRSKRRVMDGTPTEKRGGAPSGLKRLMGSEPSLTITGAAIRELIHPSENRPLTVRECARLQTFPDDFYFFGSQGQTIQQIGNAIPPLLAKYLAVHIKNQYGFDEPRINHQGALVGFTLTKAQAMSPALKRTHDKLYELKNPHYQLNLL